MVFMMKLTIIMIRKSRKVLVGEESDSFDDDYFDAYARSVERCFIIYFFLFVPISNSHWRCTSLKLIFNNDDSSLNTRYNRGLFDIF